MEAIELAAFYEANNIKVCILINDDCPEALMKRIPCRYIRYSYQGELVISAEEVGCILNELDAETLVTDLREISNGFISELRAFFCGNIVSIDEWGHRRLDADVIINPMIDSYYWDYPESRSVIYSGAEYLILPRRIRDYRGRYKIRDSVNRVCVSMGGMDTKGSSLKLAKWLPDILPGAVIEIIMGAGFSFQRELSLIIGNMSKRADFIISENVRDIYDHFLDADLVICAGGNTLHELACLGIPTVVIPTMPHEEGNGKRFEELGFGRCLSLTEVVDKGEVVEGIDGLKDRNVRTKMNLCGTNSFFGDGLDRCVRIINGLQSRYIP